MFKLLRVYVFLKRVNMNNFKKGHYAHGLALFKPVSTTYRVYI